MALKFTQPSPAPTDQSQGTKTPIDTGLLAAAQRGLRNLLSDAYEWFGPGQPLPPQEQKVEGRQFDYQHSYNLRQSVRVGEGITFPMLRNFADSYDLLRLIIETRKDQMCKLRWKFKAKEKDNEEAAQGKIDELTKVFLFPDQEHNWTDWLRMLLEDMLVLDAATIYPRMNRGGGIYGLELIDGATIKRLINSDGRTPLPPEAAYQQMLKGYPVANYTRDTLVYRPRNVRTHKVYGYSPVEQVLMTVNIAMRRQAHQLQYYTEGNIPEALIGVPETWTPEQIKQFQQFWDAMLAGETDARRHARFVPATISKSFVQTKEAALKDEYDEWLARIICFAFSVSAQWAVKQMNRATAEQADETATDEGLAPTMIWVKNTIDYIIWKYWQATDVEFAWEEEEAVNPMEQAEIHGLLVDKKIMHPDEARAERGHPPLTQQQKDDMSPPEPTVDPDGNPIAPKKKPGSADKLSKKKVKPINRERPLVRAARTKAKRFIKSFFKDEKPKVIEAVLAMYQQVAKADAGKVDAVLRALDQKGFAVFVGDESEFQDLLEIVAADGGARALQQIGIDDADITEQVNLRAVEYAQERAAEMIGMKTEGTAVVTNPNAEWSISEGTRELIRSDVTMALDEGWSTDRLAEALRTNYAFSDARAELIARTETADADVAGNLAAYAESGVVQKKEWILGPDSCEICQVNAEAGPIPIDENFPSGDDAPTAHPNCTCDLLPVIEADTE